MKARRPGCIIALNSSSTSIALTGGAILSAPAAPSPRTRP